MDAQVIDRDAGKEDATGNTQLYGTLYNREDDQEKADEEEDDWNADPDLQEGEDLVVLK